MAEKLKIKYFKTRESAETAIMDYVDKTFTNKFQDARSISKIKIVQFIRGHAIQFGDYGDYLRVTK